MEWFEEWFDCKYYHLLYKSRDFSEAEQYILKLNEKYRFKNSHSILDLACGKGRHALSLSEFGAEVFGADLSEESIQFAQQLEKKNLHFFVHDMRDELPNQYDFIFNLFTSFGYFENPMENQKVFESVAGALKEEGVFHLDFLNTRKALANLIEHEQKTIEGIEFTITKFIENNFLVKKIEFQDAGNDWEFNERVALLSQEDFIQFGKKVGLKLSNVYGDYQLNSFDEKTSDRLILEFQHQ